MSKGRGVGRGVEAELSEGVPEGVSEGVPEGVSEGVSEGVPETCVQLGVFIFFGGNFGEGYWDFYSGTCTRIGLRGGLLVLGRF